MTPQPHLVVATPCFGGLVGQRYMQSAIALLQYGTQMGLQVSIELLGYDSLITRSRNALVARFMDTPTATHLLFVDADTGFNVEQVLRMLHFDQDIVAGMYPLKLIDWDEAALTRARRGEPLLQLHRRIPDRAAFHRRHKVERVAALFATACGHT